MTTMPRIASAAAIIGTLAFPGVNALPSQAALLVGNTEGNNILLFDEQNGEFLREFIAPGSGGLLSPDDLNFGPDGNLYITSGTTPETSAILRYNGITGEFIDIFASGNGLFRPYGAAFGPDGYLYVSSFLSDEILRFDGLTGAFVDVFASGNGQPGGLNGPNDLLFSPDGSLYVTTEGSIATNGQADFSAGLPSQVLRFDLATKTSTVFAEPTPSPDSFGFVSLLGLALGFEGDLWVSDFANDIRRYDLETGDLVSVLSTNYTGTIPSNNFIGNLTFDPNNILYAVGFDFTNGNVGAILRYDGITVEPLPSVGNTSAVFVAPNDKLLRPIGITFTTQIPLKTVPEPVSVLSLLAIGVWGIQTKFRR
ncbi:hypothetical protein [Limnoraphis robusta]|uniref:Vgb family protein n=1 Tax=Limnoraphis robusta TaxID=1118279 RepID=UPI00069EF591|nr:hypothetical protein [Limnoraphis robusta]